jgi:hypothetical protein
MKVRTENFLGNRLSHGSSLGFRVQRILNSSLLYDELKLKRFAAPETHPFLPYGGKKQQLVLQGISEMALPASA